jgi:secreted trypsin-like serine protease
MVRLGDLDLQQDDDGATPMNILIEDRKVHEKYNPTTFVNDIAILRLQNDVTFTSRSLPIIQITDALEILSV